MIAASQIYRVCARSTRPIVFLGTIKTCGRKLSLCHTIRSKDVSKQVKHEVTKSFGEKAKEATKTTYYTLFVVAGIGVFGMMMYTIFGELLSSFSPQGVYSKAVDKVTQNEKVKEIIGYPMKCFGETSRRGRRRHVSHIPYEVDGTKGYRMKFYVQGSRTTGTAHLDARTTSDGWDYRYLYVQEDSYPRQVIIVEDNRSRMDNSFQLPPSISSESVNDL